MFKVVTHAYHRYFVRFLNDPNPKPDQYKRADASLATSAHANPLARQYAIPGILTS